MHNVNNENKNKLQTNYSDKRQTTMTDTVLQPANKTEMKPKTDPGTHGENAKTNPTTTTPKANTHTPHKDACQQVDRQMHPNGIPAEDEKTERKEKIHAIPKSEYKLSFRDKLISLANRRVAFNDFVETLAAPKKDPSGEITENQLEPMIIDPAGISKKYKKKIEILQEKIVQTSKRKCSPKNALSKSENNPDEIETNSNPNMILNEKQGQGSPAGPRSPKRAPTPQEGPDCSKMPRLLGKTTSP
jgi:hypothetical protein